MTIKVLYIEDDFNNVRLIRKMFKLTDYQLFEAFDGNSGFEVALRVQPYIILIDINLPDVYGVDVATYLKQSPTLQHIPIIALTADVSQETYNRCMAAGCASVIHKPVSRFLLLDTIYRLTNSALTGMTETPMTNLYNDKPLKKVLIVDDNPDLRVIFARTFDRKHFAVQVATDGVQAIESLKTDLPDILILDINMPRLNGFEVLKFVRQNQRTKDIKVVVVTGNYMAMQAPEAEYADLLLIKPVDIADLITLTQRLVPTTV